MRIASISINNFRGISKAEIFLDGHSVIIGDNNAGKSTIIEAIDLVLGPDRLNRFPIVDEHDFHNGNYIGGENPIIEIIVIVIDLEPDQKIRFKSNLDYWNINEKKLLQPGNIDQIDEPYITEALKVKFVGKYNPEEDDFEGETFFCSPEGDDSSFARFSKHDKRECGFLYLRALRTGARALSLERGSLLDIILRIKEIRPKMWEDVLNQLRNTNLTAEESNDLHGVLDGLQNAMSEFVPVDWGSHPHLKVSDLTREHLRKTLTVFMATGTEGYFAPFHHQGTGTINTMVLALLSMIAEEKKNVIFAMEEPETALPPYTQKRIVDSIRRKSTQAIFTSHSPFVLEEFAPENIILVQRNNTGVMNSLSVAFPAIIKAKNYNMEFRMRFTESLLAKRVLLTEGTTEALLYSAAARKLCELAGSKYKTLEGLGISVFNVGSENSLAIFGEYFSSMGKLLFAVFDKQSEDKLAKIKEHVAHPFEIEYKGCERMLVTEVDQAILSQFYTDLVGRGWPQHLKKYKEVVDNENSEQSIQEAIFSYLTKNKDGSGAVDLISRCTSAKQIPIAIRRTLKQINLILHPSESTAET